MTYFANTELIVPPVELADLEDEFCEHRVSTELIAKTSNTVGIG
jgi:hypothetical protein